MDDIICEYNIIIYYVISIYYYVQVDTIYSRGYDLVFCAHNIILRFIHTADNKRQ